MLAAPQAELDPFDVSALAVKVGSSADAGTAALNRLRGKNPGRMALRRRFAANVRVAYAAVAELGDALARDSFTSTTEHSPETHPTVPRIWVPALGWGLAAVVVLAVAGQIAGDDTEREGVLGAAAPEPPATASPAASAIAAPAASASAPAVASPIAIGFDDVRMASGLGADWSVQPSDAVVGVAALPNAVDRSAELEAASIPPRACRSLPQAAAQLAVSYDFLMEDGITAAQLTLEGAERQLTIALGADGGEVSSNGSGLATLEAIEAETWYRASVDTSQAEIRVAERESGGTDRTTEFPPPPPSAAYEHVCISTEGDSGAAAYFDNITIQSKGVDP
jgi:hypothetical protein